MNTQSGLKGPCPLDGWTRVPARVPRRGWVRARAPPRVTCRRVAVPLRGPGQSPVRPFACCVGSLLSVGRCGRCSCWCSRSPVVGVSSAMSLVRPAHRARSILGGAWGVGLSMCPTRALDNTGSPLPKGTMADPSSPPVLGLRLQGHRWPAATQTQRSPTLARAGAVLVGAGCAVCVSAAPNSWRTPLRHISTTFFDKERATALTTAVPRQTQCRRGGGRTPLCGRHNIGLEVLRTPTCPAGGTAVAWGPTSVPSRASLSPAMPLPVPCPPQIDRPPRRRETRNDQTAPKRCPPVRVNRLPGAAPYRVGRSLRHSLTAALRAPSTAPSLVGWGPRGMAALSLGGGRSGCRRIRADLSPASVLRPQALAQALAQARASRGC